MSTETGNINSADPDLLALVMLLRAFTASAPIPSRFVHRFGAAAIGIPEMLRCAKELGLKGTRAAYHLGAACRRAP